jgi:hypothetical protein
MDTIEQTQTLPLTPEFTNPPESFDKWRRFREEWPHVRIDHVEVRAARAADTTHGIVQAIVYLGVLLPCDVYVEMLADGTAHRHRLHSAHSLDNGSYVFEALVPVSTLRGLGECMVRVVPGAASGAGRAARPVLRYKLLRRQSGARCT